MISYNSRKIVDSILITFTNIWDECGNELMRIRNNMFPLFPLIKESAILS